MPYEPVRLGLVGCGEVTLDKHLPALRRVASIQVVALADRDAAAARRAASRFGIPRCYQSVEQLVNHPGIEAIGVCVPPGEHVGVALTAVAAGLPTLVEKPLALSLDDAETLVAAARESTSPTLMGFHMRWHRLVRQARALIRQGLVGNVESIHSVWNSPRDDVGLPAWRTRRQHGGGALVELAVHHFDLWRFVLGVEVEEVFAGSRAGVRDDEAAVVTARLSDGTLASASFSERSSHQITIEICGDAGRLRVDCLRFDGLEHYSLASLPGSARVRIGQLAHTLRELPRGLATSRYGADYLESYRRQWVHFAAVIRRGIPVGCSLDDGLEALRVVMAATESATRRQPVLVKRAVRSILPPSEA